MYKSKLSFYKIYAYIVYAFLLYIIVHLQNFMHSTGSILYHKVYYTMSWKTIFYNSNI